MQCHSKLVSSSRTCWKSSGNLESNFSSSAVVGWVKPSVLACKAGLSRDFSSLYTVACLQQMQWSRKWSAAAGLQVRIDIEFVGNARMRLCGRSQQHWHCRSATAHHECKLAGDRGQACTWLFVFSQKQWQGIAGRGSLPRIT